MYEHPCNSTKAGSGGGKSNAAGGGVLYVTTDQLLELDGWIKSNGVNGDGGGGGASAGALWVAARHFEGHGHLAVRGGDGSSQCYDRCSRCHYGGGGGGGHLRYYSPDPVRRDILRKVDVSGGAKSSSANPGSPGQICEAGHECSGHGTWSAVDRSCACQSNYYGINCAFYCDVQTTCLGQGTCTDSGGCNCSPGYVGYRCEHRCDPATDCSGHGRCSVTGKCVCDPCFTGDKCQYECSGNGTCVGKVCRCFACYVGTHCHSLCSGHGSCNRTCNCEDKWKGDFCEVPKCPKDCSGNGICNGALLQCFCNPGWRGDACDVPDCPGEPDCYERGNCAVLNGTTPACTNCTPGWMGPACDEPCVHGVQEPMDSGFCKCEACWAGKGCNTLCMGRGKCNQNTSSCDCDPLSGWRGDVCEVPRCPGIGEDCSGHGDCNGATHSCTCDEGWTGVGCHIPDCPGAPDCFNRGYCNASVEPPTCQNCSQDWMGPACNDPCKFGDQVPIDSGNCVCWAGYSGNKFHFVWRAKYFFLYTL